MHRAGKAVTVTIIHDRWGNNKTDLALDAFVAQRRARFAGQVQRKNSTGLEKAAINADLKNLQSIFDRYERMWMRETGLGDDGNC